MQKYHFFTTSVSSLVLLSALFLASVTSSWAETSEESVCAQTGTLVDNSDNCDIPQSVEDAKAGLPGAPVAVCPRPSAHYSDLLSRLNSLRLQVRNEACDESKEKIETTLKNLVYDGRETFVATIKQGVSGQQLTEAQIKEVRAYVNNVVNKGDQVANELEARFGRKLFGTKACFSKDERKSTLSFVGATVSEVSGAIGALTGPFGAQVALGGEVAGQLLQSVGRIIEKKRGYDFAKHEDLTNYFNSLCTYYDFKSELDIEKDFMHYPRRVHKAIELIERTVEEGSGVPLVANPSPLDGDAETAGFLQVASENCPICKKIISDYILRQSKNVGYGEEGDEALQDSIKGDSNRSVDSEDLEAFLMPVGGEDPGNYTADQLARIYEDLYPEEFDQISNPRQPGTGNLDGEPSEADVMPDVGLESTIIVVEEAASSEQEDGELKYEAPYRQRAPSLSPQVRTVRALQLLTWLKEEAKMLADDHRDKRAGTDQRDDVLEAKQQLEEALVSEIPRYIDFIVSDLEEAIYKLTEIANVYRLFLPRPGDRKGGLRDDLDYGDLGLNPEHNSFAITIAFQELWSVDFADVLQNGSYPIKNEKLDRKIEDLQDLKASFQTLLTNLIDAHQLVVKRCEFFENSYFVADGATYGTKIRRGCRDSKKVLAVSQDIVEKIQMTSFGDLHSYDGSALYIIFEDRPNYVMDWIDSVTAAINQDIDSMKTLSW